MLIIIISFHFFSCFFFLGICIDAFNHRHVQRMRASYTKMLFSSGIRFFFVWIFFCSVLSLHAYSSYWMYIIDFLQLSYRIGKSHTFTAHFECHFRYDWDMITPFYSHENRHKSRLGNHLCYAIHDIHTKCVLREKNVRQPKTKCQSSIHT